MRKSFLASIAAGTLLAMSVAAPAAADAHNADLTIIHAVPGATVDVWVNGAPFITSFTPGTITDPVSLAAGDYNVSITSAGDPDESGALLTATLPLEAGKNYSAIAFLDADGVLAITMFTNDISEAAAGEGRLTVRHTAAAPAVDVWADGAVLFSNLSNPDEVVGDVPAATYMVAVSATGDTDAVLGPVPLEIAAGVNTIVYAWGTLGDDLDVLVQTVSLHSGTPSGIPSGTMGLADTGSSSTGLIVALLLGLAAAGVAARVVAVRR